MPEKEPFCLDSEIRTHSAWSQTTNATIKHHIQKSELQAGFALDLWSLCLQRTCDLLITSELHYHCAIEAFRSRYEDRTRVDRLKICNPDLLDEPTRREFDRIRTCVDKCHKLAPKPLGHKLHINCSRWIRTTTSRTGIWYATITPWSSISSPQKESNLR